MSRLKSAERVLLERLFMMGGGYVLDFNTYDFDSLMASEYGVDFSAQPYDCEDLSKAKKLRAVWDAGSDDMVARLVEDLIEHRVAMDETTEDPSSAASPSLVTKCRAIARRLRSAAAIPVKDEGVVPALTHELINDHVRKCEDKLTAGDYSGAITNARSMLETVLLALHRESTGEDTDFKGDLSAMYKAVCKLMNLDPSQTGLETPLRQILAGLTSMVTGLGALRSKASDAHGRLYKTHRHHAELAVNAAKTLAHFLLSSFEYQQDAANKD